ncbi:MAG: primosomal protein N' [Desulfomonilaceae bacterium]|nr:primosomal protein N' [Desulfomonilaceae bacterium]
MSDPREFIDVSIPLPLDGPFTYRVPEGLRERVEIGRRVLAPFRNKIRAGFIVGFGSPEAGVDEIREVTDIPDEDPYLTPTLWQFLRWMSSYYLIPTGLVLKTALPPGSDRRSKPWAILTPEGRRWFGGMGDDRGLTLPNKLVRSGVMPRKDLADAIGEGGVQKALSKGWILFEERIARPRTSLRKRELPELLNPVGTRSADQEDVPEPTPHQKAAYEQIKEAVDSGGFKPFLLFGVTGSGKTEVYLRAITEVLAHGKRALVLVPEIALTPQSARRFLRRLGGGLALFHSGLTPAQRLDEWRRIRAGKVNVVIGARSGIFVPLENLGLVIVDEEHDPSYKQEDSCPYNARDMALARGKLEGACVILGSATPSFETYVNARRGKITRLDLPKRHHGGGLPTVQVVDLKENRDALRNAYLTPTLLTEVEEALARKEQVVLFLNRRGFDTFAQCRSCGHVFKCPNCDISLTHHRNARHLLCHLCGFSRASPPLCPACAGEKLFFGGVGTQKVEEMLAKQFPEARIARLDRDVVRRRDELEKILEKFRNKEIDILTGTQMIVKGHDFPGIGLVGVLCGDLSLHFPDFRAAERTFQMLTQVAGRTGRASDSGKVILQTFDPDNEAIRFAAVHEFEGFFENESIPRKELLYPPFGHLILVRVEGADEKKVENKAVRIGRAARLLKGASRDVMILGPAPSPRKKAVGRYRWQVLFKSAERNPVRALVRALMEEGLFKGSGLKVIVDVDPIDLM